MNILEEINKTISTNFDKEIIEIADMLDYHEFERIQNISTEDIAKMSQEEHEYYRKEWMACLVFNIRGMQIQRESYVKDGATKEELRDYDLKVANQLTEALSTAQKNRDTQVN